MKKLITICSLVLICAGAYAQGDYSQRYTNAKQLFREGKYNLAMESFKALIPYDQNNPYAEYAAFYYALAAYHQNYLSVAKDQLNQIKKLYPKWDKLDEVNFWLGKIHFDNHDYFQGLKLLSSIQDKKFQKDIDALKAKALDTVTDIETLKMMREEYPQDEVIARALAKQLSHNLTDDDNKEVLEKLIKDFNWKRKDLIPEAPKTYFKDKYSVAVMMPFMVKTLEPTPGKKRNQIVLDFYEGMQFAADTLTERGINIDLRAYDTENEANRIKTLLSTEELKNIDLIIGPFFQEENRIIQDFSQKTKVNVFNPFLNNIETIGENPYGFLYQPSFQTIGKKSGEFLAKYVSNKNAMVFYGTSTKDSVLATNFVQTGRHHGLNVIATHRIPREEAATITNILATPTEFDEFNYPKEFTLKKDSIGSIYVATDDPLIYSKVIGAVEARGDRVVVLGSEKWLDNSAVDLEKYQTLPIVLAAPNFTASRDREYKAFVQAYIKEHGRIPSDYAKLGYELLLFIGKQLKEHGVYFQEGFNKTEFIPGDLVEGYNFEFSRSNQLVPFITWKDEGMKVIQKL